MSICLTTPASPHAGRSPSSPLGVPVATGSHSGAVENETSFRGNEFSSSSCLSCLSLAGMRSRDNVFSFALEIGTCDASGSSKWREGALCGRRECAADFGDAVEFFERTTKGGDLRSVDGRAAPDAWGSFGYDPFLSVWRFEGRERLMMERLTSTTAALCSCCYS